MGVHDPVVFVFVGVEVPPAPTDHQSYGKRDDHGAHGDLGATLDRLRKVGVEQDHRSTDDQDRKSTRLNSSHVAISYAVFCLKQKTSTTPVRARTYTHT